MLLRGGVVEEVVEGVAGAVDVAIARRNSIRRGVVGVNSVRQQHARAASVLLAAGRAIMGGVVTPILFGCVDVWCTVPTLRQAQLHPPVCQGVPTSELFFLLC